MTAGEKQAKNSPCLGDGGRVRGAEEFSMKKKGFGGLKKKPPRVHAAYVRLLTTLSQTKEPSWEQATVLKSLSRQEKEEGSNAQR